MLTRTDAMYDILLWTKGLAEGNKPVFTESATKEEITLLDNTLDEAIALDYVELSEAVYSKEEFGVFYFEPRITKKGLEYLELLKVLKSGAN